MTVPSVIKEPTLKKKYNIQKIWAWIIGIIFLAIGIAGFAGAFEILHIIHDGLHILTGLIWIWAALIGPTKEVNKWGGIVYVVLGLIGFAGLLGAFGADLGINIYHLVVAGGASAAIGWFAK